MRRVNAFRDSKYNSEDYIAFKLVKNKHNSIFCNFIFSKHLSSKILLSAESRFLIFYDDINPRKIMFKITNEKSNSYKIFKESSSPSSRLKLFFKFKFPWKDICEKDFISRELNYEITEDGILIDASH